MKESIGSTFLYNIIFVFIIIVFGLLSATISYYKGFKVNTRILSSINKYAGYNACSNAEIENYLSSIGYTYSDTGQRECKARDGLEPITSNNSKYLYCVYYHNDETGAKNKGEKNYNSDPTYYSYSVTSYIYVDLPIVGQFKVPVYSKGERIYNFSDSQEQSSKVASGKCGISS